MDQNNLNLQLDLTKVANKTYDDLASKPLKSTGNVGSTVIDFFHNFILYPLQKYNIYAEYKLQNYKDELVKKANKIPKESLILPRVNIFGPTLEGLKYNLDEQYIKDMFTNILISDMDSTKQSKVLPAYIDIVRQLSKDDAIFLKSLKECSSYVRGFFCIELHNKDKYILLEYSDNNGKLSDFNIIKLNSIVIDNLIRLRLIEIPDRVFVNQKVYDKMYELLHQPTMIEVIQYTPRILSVTDFGKNFIDICLS